MGEAKCHNGYTAVYVCTVERKEKKLSSWDLLI